MKKVLSLLLVFVLLFGTVSFIPAFDISTVSEAYDAYEVYKTIVDAVRRFDEFIDLRDYNIYAEVEGETLIVDDMYYLIIDDLRLNPLLYFVDFTKSTFTVLSDDKLLYGMTPQYTMTKQEAIEAGKFIENEVDSLLNTLPATEGLSDLAKCIAVHDLIVSNFQFQTETGSSGYRSLYDILKYRMGVCQGYTVLYIYMLDKLGVNSTYSRSNEMGHVWNLVEIDSEWYHVDCTWDDPINYYSPGRVGHKYMLKSDSAFIDDSDKNEHYAVIDSYDCTDTTYDDYFWNNVNSPILFTDPETFWYIENNEDDYGKLIKCQNGKYSEEFVIEDRWFAYDGDGKLMNAYYKGCFSGLVYYNNCLYFNGGITIYRYNLFTGTFSEIKTVDNKNGFINSLYLRDNKLYYQQSKQIYGYGTTYTINLDTLKIGLTDIIPENCDIVKDAESGSVYITGFSPCTVGSLSLPSNAVIRNSDGKTLGKTSSVTTGSVIEIRDGEKVIESGVIIICGDTDKNGKINEEDYETIRDYVLGNKELENMLLFASDIDANGIVDMDDYIALRLSVNKK